MMRERIWFEFMNKEKDIGDDDERAHTVRVHE